MSSPIKPIAVRFTADAAMRARQMQNLLLLMMANVEVTMEVGEWS